MERHPSFFQSCILYLYLVIVSSVAMRLPMWYDELLTYYVSGLPSMKAVWAALRAGVDLNPPFLYVATRASYALFGGSGLATRFPAILGFGVMILSVSIFLRRRVSGPFALAGMLFPLLTGAVRYAAEGRSYGIVLGCAGVALVCWQAAADGRRRSLALSGISASLGLALLTHCYAVLLAVPFAVGETFRTLEKRRVDWAIWLSFVAAAAPPVALYPMLLANSNKIAVANPIFMPESFLDFYAFLLGPALWTLLAALLIAVALPMLARSDQAARSEDGISRVPLYEIAALVGFVVVPVAGFWLAKWATHVFMFRYGLSSVIGFAGLFSLVVFYGSQRLGPVGAALTVLFALVFVWPSLPRFSPSGTPNTAWLGAASGSVQMPPLLDVAVRTRLPIVIADGRRFLELDHYAEPEVVSRLYYLRDRESAIHYTGSDVFEYGYMLLPAWFPIRAHIENYPSFVAAHGSFVLYGDTDWPLGWILKRLIDDKATVEVLQLSGTQYVLIVEPKRT